MQTDRQVSDQLNTNYPLLVQVAGRHQCWKLSHLDHCGASGEEMRTDSGVDVSRFAFRLEAFCSAADLQTG